MTRDPKDPWADESDPWHLISDYRSPRQLETGGIVHALGLGAGFTLWGLWLVLNPHSLNSGPLPAVVLAVGPLLLLAGGWTLIRRRRRERDGRWG